MGLLDSLRNNPQDIDILDNPEGFQGSPFLLDDNTIYLQQGSGSTGSPSRGDILRKMLQSGRLSVM